MSAESEATIVIRGKGSVKEGKGRFTGDQNEPLHCLIIGSSQQKVDKAKELIREVIETAISTPEHENDRKRQQLRELAIINGTFRDDENQLVQHRESHLIAQAENPSLKVPAQPAGQCSFTTDQQTIDKEYKQLMSEVAGESNLGTDNRSQKKLVNLPPWRVDWYRKKGWMN